MSSDDVPPTYAAMPAIGTMRECVFCHFMVSLREVAGGWYLWTADRDPLDGRWHCDGGAGPGNAYHRVPYTLHVPVRPPQGPPWAPRYAPDGTPKHAQDSLKVRRTA